MQEINREPDPSNLSRDAASLSPHSSALHLSRQPEDTFFEIISRQYSPGMAVLIGRLKMESR